MQPEQIRELVIQRAKAVGMDKQIMDAMMSQLLDTDEHLKKMYRLMEEHDPDDPTLLLTIARMT